MFNFHKQYVIAETHKLAELVFECEWKNKSDFSNFWCEYLCSFYVLEVYKQYMNTKYPKDYVEITIRTIFFTMADSMKKAGVTLNEMTKQYSKIDQIINNFIKQNNIDEYVLVAKHMLTNEFKVTDEELKQNESQISKISNFFKDLRNI